MSSSEEFDVIIIGAGAAGLFCASQSGARGLKVLLLDHANRVGKKILMSGGGRCNFTNMYSSPEDFICHNPHFVKSALSQYSQWDFINLVEAYEIPYHEKALGQLFCDNKSSDIVQMLVREAQKQSVEIRTHCDIKTVVVDSGNYQLTTSLGAYQSKSLVIATGGLSIPTMGATGFGYDIARQFGHQVLETRPGLVPFVWDTRRQKNYDYLAGVSCLVRMHCNDASYHENMLFTHRGISGPATLKLSSHWQFGQKIRIDFLPDIAVDEQLIQARTQDPKRTLGKWLRQLLVKQVSEWLLTQIDENLTNKTLANLSNAEISSIAQHINHWQWTPSDTEGYRTAEVTMGGVDTDQLSSKTLESKLSPGLYFIGEVVDVTGQLGGYNFQWAWSSAYAAAQAV